MHEFFQLEINFRKRRRSRWARFTQKKEEETTETPVVTSGPEGEEATSGEEGAAAGQGGDTKAKKEPSELDIETPNVEPDYSIDGEGIKEFQIRVRVIEGKELEGGVDIHPLCRIYLAGKIRSTKKRRATDSPTWGQNFYFTMKCRTQELSQHHLEFKVFSARKLLKDSLVGAFKCDLGQIYARGDHSIIGRWVALSGQEEEGDTGVCGFLRISASVLAPGQFAPSLKDVPDEGTEDIMYSGSAHFRNMVMHIRVMELVDLPALDLEDEAGLFSKKPKKDEIYDFVVEAAVGNQSAITRVSSSDAPQIYQEIQMCIKWPTVAKKVFLKLFEVQSETKKVALGTVALRIADICSSEAEGYLPCFGPAFLTFYGSANPDKKKRNLINKGKEEGASFHGRIMVEILSTQTQTMAPPKVTDLDTKTYRSLESSPQSRLQKYILFCTFYAGNMIAKQYKSDNIYFEVSIGAYGNSKFASTHPSSSRTPAVMPQYDNTTYYCMPWGNKKPCAVVPSLWEQYQYRLEATNVLAAVSSYMNREAVLIRHRIGSTEDADLASEFIKVLETVICTIARPEILPTPPAGSSFNTELDLRLTNLRQTRLAQITADMIALRDKPVAIGEAVEILLIYASQIDKLSVDPQGNIPDIIIWMIASGRPVAYGRIPPNQVLFSEDVSLCGKNVGRLFPVFLHSVETDVTGLNAHKNSAVLQVMMWFGKVKERSFFMQSLLPGEMKQYAECFENETGKGREWKHCVKNPPPFSDEDGKWELPKDKFRAPEGWTFGDGKWFVSRTYDVWVDKDAGFDIFEEEVYELSKKNQKLDRWEVVGYTDYDGETTETPGDVCPDGWQWRDAYWKVDRNCPGDDDGFVYHVENTWYRGFDCTERVYHNFRRRRWVRRRVHKDGADGGDTDDEKIIFRRGDRAGWEYGTKFGRPTHLRQRYEDRFRRRRWHRELIPTEALQSDRMFTHMSMRFLQEPKAKIADAETGAAEATADVAFRTQVVYDKVHRWQLRAYIFQARDLAPIAKVGSTSTFARAVFMNRTIETQIVIDTVNPIWQQTLIFEKVLLPGAPNKIAESPPCIMVEVFHDQQGLPPKFLGRFVTYPFTCTVNKLRDGNFDRPKLKWYNLETEPGHFRGDLLAAFELFEADHVEFIGAYPGLKNAAEIEKAKKEKEKASNFLAPKPVYEVPIGIRPEYQEVNIDFLCWGVRNLRRHQLTSVKRPFVELIVSNRIESTQPIKDVTKNPNFDKPIIHLRNVLLPKDIALSAPITICLRDSRSFGRRPQVGMCVIKDFRKYLTDAPKAEKAQDMNAYLVTQLGEGTKMLQERTTQVKMDGGGLIANWQAPNFDWWSKYYASCEEGDQNDQNAYIESGYELIVILPYPLETVSLYKGFLDFCDTFTMYKVARAKASDPEYTEFAGELKGRLYLYKKDEGSADTSLANIPGLEFQGPTDCVVRVYVVRGIDLVSRRKDGRVDSYVECRLGKHKKQKSKKNKIHTDSLHPVYGEIFEFQNVTLPQDKDLRITVKDHHLITADEEIGSTTIDLENRLLTKFRATCGIQNQFHRDGINAWRDQQGPYSILLNYCRVHHLPHPSVHGAGENMFIRLGDQPGYLEFRVRDMDTLMPRKDWRRRSLFLGDLKQQLAVYVLRRLALVPEHIETRTLENYLSPGSEQGKLHLWVDIFPTRYGPIPPPVAISPRKPMPMELRLVIWNVRDVVLEKTSMDEKCADIFVKATMNGVKKSQKTDVHYRSLDGSGSFNYRMIFTFDYNPWDKEVVSTKRSILFWKKDKEEKLEPELTIQVFDNHKFSKDHLLGVIKLNLLDCEQAAVDKDYIANVKSLMSSNIWCCKGKRYKTEPGDRISMFQQKRAKGWFPVSRGCSSAGEAGTEEVTGKVELELQLLPGAAAEADPVGKARDEPNRNPSLSPPDRPMMDSHWLTSRFSAFNGMIWKKWKWWIILGIFLAIIALIILAVIWHLPAIIAKKAT